jgi:type IV pilus assembly protein PilQ
MIKRTLLTLALALAGSSWAALAPLPSDTKYDSVVTLRTGSSADDLNAVLQALGASVGLTVITQDIPAKAVNFDISGKPFREVWTLLLELNGLDYYLRPSNIVVVAPPKTLEAIKPPPVVSSAPTGPDPVREVYSVNGDAAALVTYLKAELPKATINSVGKTITVTALPSEQGVAKQLLVKVDPAPNAPADIQKPTAIPVSREFYTVNGKTSDLAALLTKELPGSSVTFNGQIISFVGTEAQHVEAARVLEEVDPAPDAPSIATERRIVEIKSDPQMLIATLAKQVPGLKAESVADKGLSLVGTPLQLSDALNILKVIDVPPATPVLLSPVVTERRIVETKVDSKTLITTLIQQVPGLKAESVSDKGLSLVGTALQLSDALGILKVIDVPPAPIVVIPPVVTERRIVETKADSKTLIATLTQQVPGLKVESVADKGLSLVGTALQLSDALGILKVIDVPPVPVFVAPVVVTERRIVEIKADPKTLIATLTQQVPGLKVESVSDKGLSLVGTALQLSDALGILKVIDVPPVLVVVAPVVVTERRIVEIKADPKTLIATLTQQVPGLKVESVSDKGLSLVGTASQLSDAVGILKVIDVPPAPVIVVAAPVTERRIVEIKTEAKALIATLTQQVPGLKVESVADKGLSLIGTPLQLADAERILKLVDVPAPVVVVQPVVAPIERRFFDITGDATDEAAVLTKQIPGLQVDFAGKTASILTVTGTATQLEDAARILKQIDRPIPIVVGPVIVQKVFTLVNATAVVVKGILEGTLKQDITIPDADVAKTGLSVTTNITPTIAQPVAQPVAGAAVATVVAPVSPVQIFVDARTNSLIVRGTQGQLDQIAALLPTLDKKVPMINVQVRIQEVTESGAANLGLDWTAGIGNFVTKIVGGNLTGLFDATRSLAGFNIGATLNASEKQGTSKRVDDASVMMESGQAKVARLRSGGKLRVNIVGTGAIIKETFDYGVIVDVGNTRIDADGTIHMEVNAKVESLLTPPTDPTLINTSNREAQTTLALKTGQTVLLGGLLSTQNKSSTTGIPFLSSLPLIGPLFSKTDTTSEKTQLLLVLTATAVD